jgi:hypothetical protein
MPCAASAARRLKLSFLLVALLGKRRSEAAEALDDFEVVEGSLGVTVERVTGIARNSEVTREPIRDAKGSMSR